MFRVGNQPFSIGLVDKLFQPTRKPAEIVEDDGYQSVSQSLIAYVMSTLTWLESGAHFQLFQPKTAEMRSIGRLQPHQPKPV